MINAVTLLLLLRYNSARRYHSERIGLMIAKHHMNIVLLLIVVFAALLTLALVGRPAAAQDTPSTMRALLERLNASGQPVTIQFAAPLVSGETTWTLPDGRVNRAIADIGDDYICFSEPWNNDTRTRCTPFVNIVGVTVTG
jgi:hypothetical protein